jgi:peptide/nickel transport system substrate-binding protein
MMGTGPFKLASWEPNQRIVLERFEGYWNGPAKLARVVRRIVTDNQTAIMLLKQGDIDFLQIVDPANLSQVEGVEGITMVKNLPSVVLRKVNFNFKFKEGSKYIGNGKLGENGIPPEFFSDIHVRKAFNYAFNFDTFINEVMLGYSKKPYGPVHIGFPTADPNTPQYTYDPEKAEEHFKKAWDGELWEKGFKFTGVYPAGSTHRQRAIQILQAEVSRINPKFHIELASLPWASYVSGVYQEIVPLSIYGMVPIVTDPYFPLYQHMGAGGFYAGAMNREHLSKEKYEELLKVLGSVYDAEKRAEVSKELQRLSYEDALSIFHQQAVMNIAMRDWVKGYKPSLTPFNVYFYTLSKS